MLTTAPEITQLLHRARDGDKAAESRVIQSVYPELKRYARRYMLSERGQHTLQPTALINEAYLKIFGGTPVEWKDRAHFLAVASQQMRRVLVDHGREFRAEKRSGNLKVSLSDENNVAEMQTHDLELTELLIQHLEKIDPPASRVTVLKFYGGMTDQEVAHTMGTSHSQVRRHWKFARTWIRQRMTETAAPAKIS